jgi:hypothetical protein
MQHEFHDAKFVQGIHSEPKLQKTHRAYIILIDLGSESELQYILPRVRIISCTQNYVVVNEGFSLNAKTHPNEKITLLFFGYMTEKE